MLTDYQNSFTVIAVIA